MTTNLAKAKSPSKRASVSYDDTNRGRFDLQPYQDRMGVKKEVGDGNEELNLRGCPGGLARKKVTLESILSESPVILRVTLDLSGLIRISRLWWASSRFLLEGTFSGLCRIFSLVKPWSLKILRLNQRS